MATAYKQLTNFGVQIMEVIILILIAWRKYTLVPNCLENYANQKLFRPYIYLIIFFHSYPKNMLAFDCFHGAYHHVQNSKSYMHKNLSVLPYLMNWKTVIVTHPFHGVLIVSKVI